MSWKLFYDGGCNLCDASQLRAAYWAQRAGQPFTAEILQSAEAIAKGYGMTEMVLEADQVYRGAEAWLKLMTIAPWYLRWVGSLGRVPGFHGLLAFGYRVVARYRYKWFGTKSCPIPPRPLK